MNTRSLALEFRDAKQKSHTLKLSNVKSDLDAQALREMMSQIAAFNIFETKDGDLLYVTPISAKYVDTTSDVLFDDDAK